MSNKTNPENLGKFFSDIVCSKHNQAVSIRFVAIAGMGKSWGGMTLAQQISYYNSLTLGGKPEDYFNFEEDLATISQERVKHVMEHAKPYHVLMLDDVSAVAMNARNFQSDNNKDMNAIIQTWRPNHNALITTQQAGFLVDKVWRNLFNFQIEIVESHFDQGFVICKVQRIVYKHNIDETYYPYLQEGRARYVRHIISAPPVEWQKKYEDERAKQLKAIREKEESGEVQIPDKEKFTLEKMFLKPILKIVETGYTSQEDIKRQLIESFGTSPSQQTISKILKNNRISS